MPMPPKVGRHKNHRITNKYAKWRDSVLKRCSFKCYICGSTTNLEAHHLIKFAISTAHQYDIKNGVALCHECHVLVHKK